MWEGLFIVYGIKQNINAKVVGGNFGIYTARKIYNVGLIVGSWGLRFMGTFN